MIHIKSPPGVLRLEQVSSALSQEEGQPMLPGYFRMFTNLVTMDMPATNLITRQALGWEPTPPKLLADLDNGGYFPAG